MRRGWMAPLALCLSLLCAAILSSSLAEAAVPLKEAELLSAWKTVSSQTVWTDPVPAGAERHRTGTRSGRSAVVLTSDAEERVTRLTVWESFRPGVWADTRLRMLRSARDTAGALCLAEQGSASYRAGRAQLNQETTQLLAPLIDPDAMIAAVLVGYQRPGTLAGHPAALDVRYQRDSSTVVATLTVELSSPFPVNAE